MDTEATTTKSDFQFQASRCGQFVYIVFVLFYQVARCAWMLSAAPPGERGLYSTSLSAFSSHKRTGKETHAARFLKARMLMCKNTECISAVKRRSYSKGLL